MLARKVPSLLFGLALTVVGLAMIFLFARESTLRCTHPEPSRVECVKEMTWLWLVPMGQATVTDVEGAWVAEAPCDEYGCTYRVVLSTGQGDVPLTDVYTSGLKWKEELVARITAFVEDGAEQTLEVREAANPLVLLGGTPFIVVGLYSIAKGLKQRNGPQATSSST